MMRLLGLIYPHEGNNFKAKVLQSSGLTALALFLFAFQLVVQFFTYNPTAQVLGYAANISIEDVIKLTNQKRQENGLATLREDSTLDAQAYLKGKDMLEHDYWAHISPNGTEPWYFFKQGGYTYKYAGENLARDFSDATSAVDAWMASPSHRENMLSDKYRDIGIGVVEGDLNGADTTIIVQFFGTRLTDTIPTQPVAFASSLPSPTPVSTPSTAALAAVKPQTEARVLISPFNTTKGISLAVVGILLVALAIDASVLSRKRIRRSGGRVFAHIAFLGMILAIILILKAGKIL